jgi:3-oxoacyl-[acyl-carrier-protein] synthase III
MIPLENAEHFLPAVAVAGFKPGKFFTYSGELLSITTRKILELYESDPKLKEGRYDVGFGHAASEKAADIVRRRLGIAEEAFVPTHALYGNTIAASVPLAMSLALDENRLRRGHKVLVVVGASGITVGIAAFTF